MMYIGMLMLMLLLLLAVVVMVVMVVMVVLVVMAGIVVGMAAVVTLVVVAAVAGNHTMCWLPNRVVLVGVAGRASGRCVQPRLHEKNRRISSMRTVMMTVGEVGMDSSMRLFLQQIYQLQLNRAQEERRKEKGKEAKERVEKAVIFTFRTRRGMVLPWSAASAAKARKQARLMRSLVPGSHVQS
jgi:hypothetical protein